MINRDLAESHLHEQQQQQQQQAPSEKRTLQSHQKRKRDDDVERDTDASSLDDEPRPWRKVKQWASGIGQEVTKEGGEEMMSCGVHVDEEAKLSERVSDGGQWSERNLRRLISNATKARALCAWAIHPTASIVANTINIPSTPIGVFKTLQSILPSIPATLSWKLEFQSRPRADRVQTLARTRRERGYLTITMPTRVHEAFISFSQDIADQLFDSHFLPPRYKRRMIFQSGSAELKRDFGGLVPDAGISFFNLRNTFLVLEVAYSQKEEHAQRKAQDYILGTDGKIKFVVLVIITKRPRKRTTIPQDSTTDETDLSPDHDTVHVHVYKSARKPPNTLTGEHPIDKVQIFPGPAPTDTFTITWSDINSGTWSDFRDGARLPPDAPAPTCQINFDALVTIARTLAGQADDDRDGTPLYLPEVADNVDTPVINRETFVNSSSPAVYLSSGGTVLSDEGRRLDPDYQPSIGSNESSDSY